MRETLAAPDAATVDGLVRLTHLIYALHSLAIVTGLLGSATIVGSFVGGVPSIIAVVLNYAKRADTRGTFLESHFRWQIRTFWWALAWVVVAALLFVTVIGIPLAFLVFLGAGIWVVYRIVRGWLALNERRPMPD
ncbi:MAG TPA: hypothetical protein VNO26_02730 [Candidatus Limnocylindria bacterium]|nr:hypothetical protein [Candidatus Limnocylindria bacterium]